MLTPTQLRNEMMLSSGATTHRIDLLEKRSLIERMDDPNDRRGTLVKLTREGVMLVDEVTEAHLALEHELLAPLTTEQKQDLAGLLAELAITFE